MEREDVDEDTRTYAERVKIKIRENGIGLVRNISGTCPKRRIYSPVYTEY